MYPDASFTPVSLVLLTQANFTAFTVPTDPLPTNAPLHVRFVYSFCEFRYVQKKEENKNPGGGGALPAC